MKFPLAPYNSWFFYLIALLPLAIAGFMLYMGFGFNRVGLAVSGDKLEIQGIFYGRSIEKSHLKLGEARVVNLNEDGKDLTPRRRKNGVKISALAFGWFKLENGEKALVAVSDRSKAVYIPTTDGYSLLLSPQDPQAFVAALKGN